MEAFLKGCVFCNQLLFSEDGFSDVGAFGTRVGSAERLLFFMLFLDA